ncbi:MAG: hypothetical protein LBH81_03690 [Rickettsiales bacterium]|jgi:hypothetical protein|nr:hypothetical protein [Rickettsiales bacterium]
MNKIQSAPKIIELCPNIKHILGVGDWNQYFQKWLNGGFSEGGRGWCRDNYFSIDLAPFNPLRWENYLPRFFTGEELSFMGKFTMTADAWHEDLVGSGWLHFGVNEAGDLCIRISGPRKELGDDDYPATDWLATYCDLNGQVKQDARRAFWEKFVRPVWENKGRPNLFARRVAEMLAAERAAEMKTWPTPAERLDALIAERERLYRPLKIPSRRDAVARAMAERTKK